MTTQYKYLLVSYTHLLNGKPTTLGGPAVALSEYLGNKAYCIWQPISINKPIWYYAILKIRDIFLVLLKHKPAKVYIGVESINALLGKLLGYKKVIYWNLDYSSSRWWVWHLFDKIAIKLSDEVWTLSPRGYKTVPIGYWKKRQKKVKRDKKGVVYIGLLQDMQGVEGLIWFGLLNPSLNITIIGSGKDEKKYKEMSKYALNIKFTGVISDEEAVSIMMKNTYGWANYHPLNPTHSTTPPTKPVTYISCGLKVWGDFNEPVYTWDKIFKYALNSRPYNKGYKYTKDIS